MPTYPTLRVSLQADPAAAARRAAQFFADTLCDAVQQRGSAAFAVSGGSTPEAAFRLLASPDEPFRPSIPWKKLHLFWADERMVPPTHPDSNYRMTREALLDHVPIPARQIHRFQTEEGPALAACKYEIALHRHFGTGMSYPPGLDLVALGMGEDGHTASLFPFTDALQARPGVNGAVDNFVPQLNAYRLTLTAPYINLARQVCFLVTGANKAKVLREVFFGPRDPERLPSQLIQPASGILTLILDRAAAAEFPLENGAGAWQLETIQ